MANASGNYTQEGSKLYPISRRINVMGRDFYPPNAHVRRMDEPDWGVYYFDFYHTTRTSQMGPRKGNLASRRRRFFVPQPSTGLKMELEKMDEEMRMKDPSEVGEEFLIRKTKGVMLQSSNGNKLVLGIPERTSIDYPHIFTLGPDLPHQIAGWPYEVIVPRVGEFWPHFPFNVVTLEVWEFGFYAKKPTKVQVRRPAFSLSGMKVKIVTIECEEDWTDKCLQIQPNISWGKFIRAGPCINMPPPEEQGGQVVPWRPWGPGNLKPGLNQSNQMYLEQQNVLMGAGENRNWWSCQARQYKRDKEMFQTLEDNQMGRGKVTPKGKYVSWIMEEMTKITNPEPPRLWDLFSDGDYESQRRDLFRKTPEDAYLSFMANMLKGQEANDYKRPEDDDQSSEMSDGISDDSAVSNADTVDLKLMDGDEAFAVDEHVPQVEDMDEDDEDDNSDGDNESVPELAAMSLVEGRDFVFVKRPEGQVEESYTPTSPACSVISDEPLPEEDGERSPPKKCKRTYTQLTETSKSAAQRELQYDKEAESRQMKTRITQMIRGLLEEARLARRSGRWDTWKQHIQAEIREIEGDEGSPSAASAQPPLNPRATQCRICHKPKAGPQGTDRCCCKVTRIYEAVPLCDSCLNGRPGCQCIPGGYYDLSEGRYVSFFERMVTDLRGSVDRCPVCGASTEAPGDWGCK